tara:strand:+ start:2233 stop:3222 length:990 start_codon:yes stop_codon:yes gene_type:complete
MANYIESGQEVNKDYFSSAEPKETSFSNKDGAPVKFNEQKLFYNYGTVEDPVIGDVLIEGSLMKSNGLKVRDEGMQKSKAGIDYHKINYSIMLTVDLADKDIKEESKQSLKILREAYIGCVKTMIPFKGKLGMNHLDINNPEASMKNFVYYPCNGNGDIIEGRNPSIWADLENYGTNKTIFTDMKGNTIDWKLIEKSECVLMPLFHLKTIFVGVSKKIKVSLKSAIVVKISAAGSETTQLSTLERLKAKYGSGKVDEVEAQLAELRMANQDELQQASPSFGERDHTEATMHDIADETTKGESLQDFLGSAPSMPAAPTGLPKVTTLKIN